MSFIVKNVSCLIKDLHLFPNSSIIKIGMVRNICRLILMVFVMLVSSSNEKKTALCKFIDYSTPLAEVVMFKDGLWGVKARNKEQMFALNILMDPLIPIVTMTRKAGCGKTLLAIAAGLQQIMEDKTKRYKKLVDASKEKKALLIDDVIKKVKSNLDVDKELKILVNYERNKQLNQLSNIFFNKIKNNTLINEI